MTIGIVIMGLLVGTLVGLTGVGAASLLTPILVLMGIHPSIAVGTDLVYNSVTKLFGFVQHARQKTVNYPLVKYLAFGSIPGAAAAVVGLHVFSGWYHNEEQVIQYILGFVLMVAAVGTLIRVLFDSRLKVNHLQSKPLEEKVGLTIFIGVIFGFIVGLTSIGSGSLFALAMLYLYRLSGPEMVGTDIAHAFLLATVAGALNAGLGHVNYTLVGNLLVGSIPGVVIGSALSTKVPSRPIRLVMSVLIFLSGLKLV
ncbi:sulfite exporter TauE/SafE family protein [Alicyclobacillus fastidiosus]|uniref:Probable membrane transporter protein n=1 Tax=Alicyclobacillus fastidiosus TaxID=392011 RepID=A0ABY6ZKV7_9BACL|nr:sulfite exporter TauE/SafE family protein [Alicyclobacillus fastidiosus]WAH43435.1 sulfite exporter TauE/SafE family protein [Alicyclobacillus fastidiosus]GMA59588.1 UPF0721 transmembrane protein YjnA [Alicyclobacillus fastidiosus]GMA65514.1 UPF0721 transmembrane protein YjnA [Alicyclobacillus fastidiosus]